MDLLDRLIVTHRRLIGAACAGLAVFIGLTALRPAPETSAGPGERVVVAARDLPSGQVLTADDLQVRRFPARLAPAGSATDPDRLVGERLAGPVRAGEALTDRRLIDPLDLGGYAIDGPAAVTTVRIADPGVLAAVRVGDRVDIIAPALDAGGIDAGDAGRSGPRILAAGAVVVALPPADDADPAGGALTVATAREAAPALAAAALEGDLTIVTAVGTDR